MSDSISTINGVFDHIEYNELSIKEYIVINLKHSKNNLEEIRDRLVVDIVIQDVYYIIHDSFYKALKKYGTSLIEQINKTADPSVFLLKNLVMVDNAGSLLSEISGLVVRNARPKIVDKLEKEYLQQTNYTDIALKIIMSQEIPVQYYESMLLQDNVNNIPIIKISLRIPKESARFIANTTKVMFNDEVMYSPGESAMFKMPAARSIEYSVKHLGENNLDLSLEPTLDSTPGIELDNSTSITLDFVYEYEFTV